MDKTNNFIMEIDADIIYKELDYLIKNGEKFFGILPLSDINISDINDYIYEIESVLTYGLMDYFKNAMYKYLDNVQFIEKILKKY